jgi:hypothetical protein
LDGEGTGGKKLDGEGVALVGGDGLLASVFESGDELVGFRVEGGFLADSEDKTRRDEDGQSQEGDGDQELDEGKAQAGYGQSRVGG